MESFRCNSHSKQFAKLHLRPFNYAWLWPSTQIQVLSQVGGRRSGHQNTHPRSISYLHTCSHVDHWIYLQKIFFLYIWLQVFSNFIFFFNISIYTFFFRYQITMFYLTYFYHCISLRYTWYLFPLHKLCPITVAEDCYVKS